MYTITRAEPDDAETIARFNQAMALETEDKELPWQTILTGVQAMLDNDDLGFYLVAREDNEVLSCLGITFEWSDWRNGLFWWIQSVYVAPAHRNRGVFSAMYGHVRQEALSDTRSCGIRLYVERDNETAYRTYTRLGMIETDYRLMEELLQHDA